MGVRFPPWAPRGLTARVGRGASVSGREGYVKLYWVFLALFLAAVIMFVAAAITGNAPLGLAAIVLTVLLFLARGRFRYDKS